MNLPIRVLPRILAGSSKMASFARVSPFTLSLGSVKSRPRIRHCKRGQTCGYHPPLITLLIVIAHQQTGKPKNASRHSGSSFIDACLTVGCGEDQPPILRFPCDNRCGVAFTEPRTHKSVEDEITHRDLVKEMSCGIRVGYKGRHDRLMPCSEVSQVWHC